MIPPQITIGTVTHGRTRRSTRNLLAHLYKADGQTVRVVAIENVTARTAEEALRIMELMRDGSKKAEIAFHHITINPLRRLSEEQRDQAVQRILQAFSAEEHPWVLWEHDGKKRATANAADHHFHLVLGHVGPTLKALDTRRSYARLEAVARSLEVDWGVEVLTPTGRHKAVAAAARKQGRDDVAQAILAMMPKDPEDLPRSTMSSRTRARAARHGINLPRERVRIAEAYRSADTGKAARAAITALGFSLIKGEEENVWLVMKSDILLGALDRLVRAKRKEVAACLDGGRHDDQADVSPTADAPIEQAASDQTGLDHDRGDLEACHSQLTISCAEDPMESEAPSQAHPADVEMWAPHSPGSPMGADKMQEVASLVSTERGALRGGFPSARVGSDLPQPIGHNVVATDSLYDRIHKRVTAAYDVLRRAQDPLPPIPLALSKAQTELQIACKARDQAERDVTRLQAELENLGGDASGGVWVWRRGARRQHQEAIDAAEAALAEAKRTWAAAEQAARDGAERVKDLSRAFDRDNIQHSRKREADIEWAKGELAWLLDAKGILESDPALARKGWDALEQAISKMRFEMADHPDPDEPSCDLENESVGIRF
ncbi:relaxase/mobilization nuclease domain-containing protein [Microvirga sp. G4-2]|uniref:relaxase/mobilization nuclease domain-containing protein n=1 Tax=Microvirga sp. G4-2 TaxID=3434467 RepID=UPI0040444199